MRRKPIKKELRKLVFKKYGGRCAYCGCELTMQTMQVDHLVAVAYSADILKQEPDHSYENLMPACRLCNYYKAESGLELFRKCLGTLMSRVEKSFIFRLAETYGMVERKEWDGKFYFERLKELLKSL